MKKVLWSTAIALVILTLTGCAGTAGPVPTGERPPQATVENVPHSPTPVEKEQISFSAGNIPLAEDDVKSEGTDRDTEPVPVDKPDPSPRTARSPSTQGSTRACSVSGHIGTGCAEKDRGKLHPRAQRGARTGDHPGPHCSN